MLIAAGLALVLSTAKETVPGVPIDYLPPKSGKYIGSPALAILPDGNLIAAHDEFGPKSRQRTKPLTRLFRSTDGGKTWSTLPDIAGAFWSSLFVHQGSLYLLGTDREYGNLVIRRSNDEGRTWKTSVLRDDAQYATAPVPIVESNGRLWRALEQRNPQHGWAGSFQAAMMSIDENVDLLNPAAWQITNFVKQDPSWNGGDMNGWLEGNAVLTPDGGVASLFRVDTKSTAEKAALLTTSDDGKTLTIDPATGFVPFPGGAKKFTVRWDPESRRYWSLSDVVSPGTRKLPPAKTRNTLALCSSPDLRTWKIDSVVLAHGNAKKYAFQYADWQIDGNDLVFVSRTAFRGPDGNANSAHNADYLTFHRIPNFRNLESSNR